MVESKFKDSSLTKGKLISLHIELEAISCLLQLNVQNVHSYITYVCLYIYISIEKLYSSQEIPVDTEI